MAQLRQHRINIDTVAANHAAENDQPVDKKQSMTYLISELIAFFKEFQSGKAIDVAGNNRVAELEKQLRETQQLLASQSQPQTKATTTEQSNNIELNDDVEKNNTAAEGLTDKDIEDTIEHFDSPVLHHEPPLVEGADSAPSHGSLKTRPGPIEVLDETPPQKKARLHQESTTQRTSEALPPPMEDAASSSNKTPEATIPSKKIQKSIFQIMGKGHKPANEMDTASLLHQPVKVSDFLVQHYKGATTEKQLMRWVGSLSLPKAKNDKLKNWIQRATKFYDDLPDAEKTGLESTLVRWGIPAKQVGKLQGNAAVIIIGVALVTKE